MVQTQRLNLPLEPTHRKKWDSETFSFFKQTAHSVLKTFNPFQLVFSFMVVITAIGELLSRELSWLWYLLLFMVLLIALKIQLAPTTVIEGKEEKHE